jgi:hypothetical protein
VHPVLFLFSTDFVIHGARDFPIVFGSQIQTLPIRTCVDVYCVETSSTRRNCFSFEQLPSLYSILTDMCVWYCFPKHKIVPLTCVPCL